MKPLPCRYPRISNYLCPARGSCLDFVLWYEEKQQEKQKMDYEQGKLKEEELFVWEGISCRECPYREIKSIFALELPLLQSIDCAELAGAG